MSRQKSLIRISELLARFSVQVAIQNANAMYDLNIIAEDTLIPLLNEAFGYDLSNAKYAESNNSFPGIDLVDREKRVAIQVTCTSSLEKVKHTLAQILKHKLYEDFDDFYIYIITQKNDSYNENKIKDAANGLVRFDSSKIIDQTDLYKRIASLSINTIQKIESILEKELGDSSKTDALIGSNLPSIIQRLNDDLTVKYLLEELKGYYETRNIWLKKKNHFEREEPIITDTAQRFSLMHHLKECTDRIAEIDKSIANVLIKLKED